MAVLAEPKPALAPARWELRFRYQDPQRVSVDLPGESAPVVYWYMLYTVENDGPTEVDFYPAFELVTSTLRIVPSEQEVSPEAFKAIQRRANNDLLVPPHKMAGRLQRGKDRMRHGVAIWRDFDPKAQEFTIYVGGLSGETQRIKNPAFDPNLAEDAKNPRYFVFRKTLAVAYKLPGSPASRVMVKPERIPDGQKWIMR